MLEKIGSAQVNEYMVKAAHILRSQSAEISTLKAKVASFERQKYAEKIASVAVERGVLAEDESDEYVERLASGGEDLKMVEEFVGRASHGLPLGRALEKTASTESETPVGEDVLTNFLLNSDLAR